MISSAFFTLRRGLRILDGPEGVTASELITVNESDIVNISCTAEGNPNPTITWSRVYPTFNRSRVPLSTGLGYAPLIIHPVRKTDTAKYQCQASSVVSDPPPVTTKLIVTQAPTEERDVRGSGSSWAAVGSTGRLKCRVRAAPRPTFEWTTREGVQLKTSEKYTVLAPKILDELVQWTSVLEVHQVGRDDYGNYTCSASNIFGGVVISRGLNQPSRPHPPTNFSVMNVTSSSLILSWTPNFGGGMPQGYLVRYRTEKESKYQVVEISGGEAVSTTLSNLQSNTNYIFTIQAKNEQGLSAYVTPPIVATIQDIAGEASTVVGANWRIPRLMVLILTLSGAALLVLNVSIIACFLRRRKNATRNTSASSSSKSMALDAYGITPASTPGANQCDALLSLTTMSSTNFSNTTLPQKDDDRMNEDDIDRTSLVILNTGVPSQHQSPTPWVLGKQQNGDLLRNVGLPLESFDEQQLLTGDNEVQEERNDNETTETALNTNLLEPASFVPSPEVTSLCSSIYDALPCESQHESCKNSSPYLNDDQVSLASYHTDTMGAYPRTYSCMLNASGYPPGSEAEPLVSQEQFQIPLGCYRSHGYQPLVQSHQQQIYTHQTQPQQMQQQVSQQQQYAPYGMMPYGSQALSVYTEGSNYLDSKCSRSFSTGTPLGYSTLGSRSRRIPTSESSLQYQPLHPDYSQTTSLMDSLSLTEAVQGRTIERFRRSSFHGQKQRGVAGFGKPGNSQRSPYDLPKNGSCVVHGNDLLSKKGSNLAQFPQHEGSGVGMAGGGALMGGRGPRVTFASPEVSTSFVETNTTEVETSCAVSGSMDSLKTLASCSTPELVANSSL